MKKLQRVEALRLRTTFGWSTIKIAKELGVAKSSVFQWVKDAPLTCEQRESLYKGKNFKWRAGVDANVKKWREKRLGYQLLGKEEVKYDNWEHAAGCMLFWAEGDKKKNTVAFTNSDAEMMKFFVNFLKKHYDISNELVSLNFQYHSGGLEKEEIFLYWTQFLGLTGCKRSKPYCKQRKAGVVAKHQYGICRVVVNSTELVNRLWGSIQKYIGFEKPAGLEKI